MRTYKIALENDFSNVQFTVGVGATGVEGDKVAELNHVLQLFLDDLDVDIRPMELCDALWEAKGQNPDLIDASTEKGLQRKKILDRICLDDGFYHKLGPIFSIVVDSVRICPTVIGYYSICSTNRGEDQ